MRVKEGVEVELREGVGEGGYLGFLQDDRQLHDREQVQNGEHVSCVRALLSYASMRLRAHAATEDQKHRACESAVGSSSNTRH